MLVLQCLRYGRASNSERHINFSWWVQCFLQYILNILSSIGHTVSEIKKKSRTKLINDQERESRNFWVSMTKCQRLPYFASYVAIRMDSRSKSFGTLFKIFFNPGSVIDFLIDSLLKRHLIRSLCYKREGNTESSFHLPKTGSQFWDLFFLRRYSLPYFGQQVNGYYLILFTQWQEYSFIFFTRQIPHIAIFWSKLMKNDEMTVRHVRQILGDFELTRLFFPFSDLLLLHHN